MARFGSPGSPRGATVALWFLLTAPFLLATAQNEFVRGHTGESPTAYVAVLDASLSRSSALSAGGIVTARQHLVKTITTLGASGIKTLPTLNNVLAFTGSVDVANKISSTPGVKSVYPAAKRYLHQTTCPSCSGLASIPANLSAAETTPYGISMVQANDPTFLSSVGGTAAPGVTLCIIDTGVDARHPDLVGNNQDGYTPSSLDPSYPFGELLFPWNQPSGAIHSTHVTGTVAARQNGLGVIGTISGGVNLYNVNVFGPYESTSDWQVGEALEACFTNLAQKQATDPLHKMVVSMSLGGSGATYLEDAMFSYGYSSGDILFVASAGNSGDGTTNYPAGYSSVVSVAAVDCSATVADFSTFNTDVEISAPGVSVLSSLPTNSSGIAEMSLQNATSTVAQFALEATDGGVANPVSSVTGILVDCGAANGTCPAAVQGNICVVDRGVPGSPVLCDRVRTCMAAGATAVIVIANGCQAAFTLKCTTFDPSCTCPFTPDFVPSFGVSNSDGATLRRYMAAGIANVTITINSFWGALDGTSMAAPHVSGVAAKLWNSFRRCSNDIIRQALTFTAKDLGDSGQDPHYGFGLIQARTAVNWLQKQPCAKTPSPPSPPSPPPRHHKSPPPHKRPKRSPPRRKPPPPKHHK